MGLQAGGVPSLRPGTKGPPKGPPLAGSPSACNAALHSRPAPTSRARPPGRLRLPVLH